jgi:asparagine synthase (glutamine-hydrolysing)
MTATLGHTRLSILDLSAAGNQPMASPDGRYTVVFNGEVYNHGELAQRAASLGWVFSGSSDTEVLLACWSLFGPAVLDDLNGMFAFGVVDSVTGDVALVRDRFGVKPLHYTVTDGAVVFASTPDALAHVVGPIELDRVTLGRGFRTWAYEADDGRTSFQGILEVPPGCLLQITPDRGATRVRVTRWYDFSSAVAARRATQAEGNETTAIRDLIRNSISLRLRADVPVGVSLSGGLDSAIIAATAAESSGESVPAFSFSLGPDDKETLAIGELVRFLGPRKLDVVQVGPPSTRDLRTTMSRAILSQGAPVAGLSSLAQFRVFQKARESGVKVILGGQGADEAFMGYRKYQAALVRSALMGRRYWEAGLASAFLVRTLIAEGGDRRIYLGAARRYTGSRKKPGLDTLLPGHVHLPFPTDPARLQLDDVNRFGLPTLLRMEDRNSMAHSVESRHPFMDFRVMEFGAALPPGVKIHDGYGKHILRRAFEHTIPASIAWARFKRGFVPGDHTWLALGAGAHLRSFVDANRRLIEEALELPSGIVDGRRFSDQTLGRSSSAMNEALLLAWVGLTLGPSEGD